MDEVFMHAEFALSRLSILPEVAIAGFACQMVILINLNIYLDIMRYA